jgi:DNA polymerase-3 subunit delta'
MYPPSWLLGNRRLIGQLNVRKKLTHVLSTGHLGHAYLFTGNPGVGKTATALAFAEALQGIDHLSDLHGYAASGKKSWFYHPDIHVFFPILKQANDKPPRTEDLRQLLQGLEEDPYASLEFASLENADDDMRKKRGFYPITYFREEIRPRAYLRPNEGRFTVIIITRIETMRPEAANAFLKVLEEPGERVIFILTADRVDALLPTILSRCQIVPFTPLTSHEIKEGLIRHYGYGEAEASFLSRISGGSFAIARSHDLELFRVHRDAVVAFLRASYSMQNGKLLPMVTELAKENTVETLLRFLSLLEVFLHDVAMYRASGDATLITNADQADVIIKFCASLEKARMNEMFDEINWARALIGQNISPKLTLLVLGQRLHALLRGLPRVIETEETWQHMPALFKYS